MNIKSEDVVKSVESNNVESTSNEQRQTNKPIVISRRRLLRAGVAGIPVVLTMTGIAPAGGIQTEPSAASAMWYGGNAVYNRFANENGILKDGLVRTDHNGFVLLSEGGVKTSRLTLSTDTTSLSTGEVTFSIPGTYVGGGTQPEGDPPSISFKASITPPTNLSVDAYLHKTGQWYTDLEVGNAELLDYIKTLELKIEDVTNSEEVTSVNGGATFDKTINNPTFTSSNEWYNSKVQGWTIEDGESNVEQFYYLLPSSNTTINAVNYNATVSFTYTFGDYSYSCTNKVITIPLKLDVTGVPSQINPGGI